jgi:hypothetical protein
MQMKLFRVVTEHESRLPDAKAGELLRSERWYAAESIQAVWTEIALDRMDEDVTILGIIEHAPAVHVVSSV